MSSDPDLPAPDEPPPPGKLASLKQFLQLTFVRWADEGIKIPIVGRNIALTRALVGLFFVIAIAFAYFNVVPTIAVVSALVLGLLLVFGVILETVARLSRADNQVIRWTSILAFVFTVFLLFGSITLTISAVAFKRPEELHRLIHLLIGTAKSEPEKPAPPQRAEVPKVFDSVTKPFEDDGIEALARHPDEQWRSMCANSLLQLATGMKSGMAPLSPNKEAVTLVTKMTAPFERGGHDPFDIEFKFGKVKAVQVVPFLVCKRGDVKAFLPLALSKEIVPEVERSCTFAVPECVEGEEIAVFTAMSQADYDANMHDRECFKLRPRHPSKR